MKLSDLLIEGAHAIESSANSDSARLDSEILLMHALDKSRSFLFAYPEVVISQQHVSLFRSMVERRVRGCPIAYITGLRDFWSMTLLVDKRVLIPQPDTECLISKILELPLSGNARIVDLGTGSGAIALALALERPEWFCVASDVNADALVVAHSNVNRHLNKNSKLGHVPNCVLLQASWLDALAANSFNLIVSNPPYIDVLDEHLQCGDVRFEPRLALVSPQQGLSDIEIIAEQAAHCLLGDGFLVLEHGWEQQLEVIEILNKNKYANVQGYCDLAGRDRFVVAQKAVIA